ncbi:MAG: hypothetical protein AAFX53_09560 [Bacteroidota bacterium]
MSLQKLLPFGNISHGKKNHLYAFVPVPSEEIIGISCLKAGSFGIKSIQLLGYHGDISRTQAKDKLSIKVPKGIDLEHTWVFKIEPKRAM